MEKLNKLIFNGEEYLPKEVLLKWIREISDAVNSFSDRADPIRAQGANKVISLLLEKIEPPQEHWKPSEEQQEVDLEEEMRKELQLHYSDDQDVYWWNYLKNSFRHFYELGLKAK